MVIPTGINVEHPVPLHTDEVVRRLEDFPELLQALRWIGLSLEYNAKAKAAPRERR